jgi:hypothetical protein
VKALAQENGFNTSQRNFASKRHARPEVQRLIELANSVSPEIDLPSPKGRVREVVNLLRSKAFSRFREMTGPIEADTFLIKLIGPKAPQMFSKVMKNYMSLRDGRAWLRQCTQIGRLSPMARMRYLMPAVSAHTNERGELEFDVDPLVKILQGVEASRIRICPICKLLFWASRRDQPCCVIQCAKILRTRLWRESFEIKYRSQRREKKDARRTLAEQREREQLAEARAPESKHNARSARLPALQRNR